MADINSLFISINMYSSALDKMIIKTNQAINSLMNAGSYMDTVASKMLTTASVMDVASSKMLTISEATETAANQLLKASEITEQVSEKMISIGAASDEAAEKIEDAGDSTEDASKKMDDASKNTKKMNEELNKTDKSTKKAESGVKKLLSALGKLKKLQKVFKLADSLTLANTKLEAVNDGPKGALQDKVFAAAGQSRTSFTNMAGYVASLEGIQGNLFGSNDETLAFAQLAQKSFAAGGASSDESKASMGKLIESMSKGSLSGDNFRAITQNAPLILEAISTYTGKSGEELRALADQGKLSAADMKNALFAMSGEINEQFAQTPMTFADIWTRIKDGGLQAFSGILEKVTELVSSPDFQQFLNMVITGFGMVAEGVSNFIGLLVSGWEIIEPILGVIGIVLLAGIIASLWAMIPPLFAQIGAWITMALPVLGIVAVIGLVIATLGGLGATWEEVFGMIGGLLGTLAGIFYNIFVFIWNIVVDYVNFFGNAFNDPLSAIKIGILDLGITVMNAIENIVKGFIDLFKLLGIERQMPEWITNPLEWMNNKKAEIMANSEYKVYMETKDMVELSDAAKKGSDIGKQIPGLADDIFNKLSDSMSLDGKDENPSFDYSQYTGPTGTAMDPVTVEGTGSGGSIPVEMPDEDLSYLRDIAERDYIANIASNSLAPNISIQFGDVHETADANKVAGRIKKILQEEIAMVSEGVY